MKRQRETESPSLISNDQSNKQQKKQNGNKSPSPIPNQQNNKKSSTTTTTTSSNSNGDGDLKSYQVSSNLFRLFKLFFGSLLFLKSEKKKKKNLCSYF